MPPIQHATVLGAGTMGAQIAAHLANAGVRVLLLDTSAETAAEGLKRARGLKPDPLFTVEAGRLVTTAGFERLLDARQSDWIIEAVVENLDIKKDLMARVDECRGDRAIVSSNTSGIPLAAIADGRSAGFRRHWLGTHFFNPPRYLHLVELIPTADTDPAVTAGLAQFLDVRLGKGTVVAKDCPAFIANRIGLFGLVRFLDALASGAYSVEDIDAITGPLIGRPKSATFRTLDIAGLDVLALVTRDLVKRLPADEKTSFELPPLVERLIEKNWLGEKSGRGFYRRVREGEQTRILALDVAALMEGDPDPYRPAATPDLASMAGARAIPDLAERLRALHRADDRAGALVRNALVPTLEYAVRVAPHVAGSMDDVDRAMQWGFGWAFGPQETLDAIEDRQPRRTPPPAKPGFLILRTAKQGGGVVSRNAAADLVDLGDGVFCVEFHSKMNTIGDETIATLMSGVDEASANGVALVVGNEAEQFSAGANLKALFAAAQDQQWDGIDAMVRRFQRATMALKTAPVPVVAAAAGLTLGGGCEICLHADRVQAAAETYMGLVETGVGLIPAAGGSKEMLLRTAGDGKALQRVFETIGLARVSTSAADAGRLGYLRDVDGITMNRDRLIADAKATALYRARNGYRPYFARTDVTAGGADTFAVLSLGVHLHQRAGRISDYDALVARKLAWVLSGGDLAHRDVVSEDRLLDLEREAFLSLCGEPKTLARIAHTLKTGKALRN